jgi:hypothetical protein
LLKKYLKIAILLQLFNIDNCFCLINRSQAQHDLVEHQRMEEKGLQRRATPPLLKARLNNNWGF